MSKNVTDYGREAVNENISKYKLIGSSKIILWNLRRRFRTI